MNDIDQKLLEGLHELAADGPREAPLALEERLVGELRRRSRARRRNAWLGLGVVTIAACLALVMIRAVPVRPGQSIAQVEVAETPDPSDQVALNFYPLPDSDELPPLESATIVRVQLPMSSLRLMGLPVSEEGAADFVEADMLLGQDGLARGVRFVE